MDDKDFENLMASIKEAGAIRRGEIAPSRVHEFSRADIIIPYSRLRLVGSCLWRILLAAGLGTLAGTARAALVFKLRGVELQKVFAHQVEDGMATFATYVILGAVFGFLIGLVYAMWYYFNATAKLSVVLIQKR